MIWDSAEAFFNMGGYALYVWGAVSVTFGLMAVEVMILLARRRNALRQVGRRNGPGMEEEHES
jgi:heme exporter protein D